MVMMTIALPISVSNISSDTADTWNIVISVQESSSVYESFDDAGEMVEFVDLFSPTLPAVSRRNDKSV